MPRYLIVAIVLLVVIGLYLGSYVLNHKTLAPKGVETDPGCDGCESDSCSLHTNPNPPRDNKK